VRHALLSAATATALLAMATPAAANGRFPASNQLFFGPSDPQLVVLRSTFGIMRSKDGGGTWQWLCEDALGLPPTSNEDPTLALTANDSLIAGLSLGLEVSPDTGCSWKTVVTNGLGGQFVKDLAVRPDSPHTVVAITSTFGPQAGADGGAGYVQGVYTSPDDGASWTQLGTIDPGAIVTTIDVAASDPQRLYVAGFRGEGSSRTASLFVSINGGQAWTERPITQFDPAHETAVYIAAVDAQNADKVYLRSEGSSRLIVTGDGGKSFTTPFSLQDQMQGFALSPDGSKVWVGGPNVGLYVASTADLAFTAVPEKLPSGATRTLHVQCLAARGSELWACSDEPSGFIVGTSTDGGSTFLARLHLTTIAGAATCPAGTTSSMCTSTDVDASPPYNPFGSLCSNLGVCFDGGATYPLSEACVEAGVCDFGTSSGSGSGGSGSGGSSGGSSGASSSGGDAGTGGGGGSKSSCGCSVVGGGGAAGVVAASALALLALGRRRRTR
jgi:MYXO-CTERM domain-containing protein